MIQDACDQQIPVGIIHQQDSGSYAGEVCVAGIPHILSTYPDGRMDIYITGTQKCRLLDCEKEAPYKVYSYRPLDEKFSADQSFEMELASLRNYLERWAIHFLPEPVQRENFITTLDEPEILINYCAVFLVEDPNMKKKIMVANTIEDKIKVLLHVMGPKEVSLGPFMPSLKF